MRQETMCDQCKQIKGNSAFRKIDPKKKNSPKQTTCRVCLSSGPEVSKNKRFPSGRLKNNKQITEDRFMSSIERSFLLCGGRA